MTSPYDGTDPRFDYGESPDGDDMLAEIRGLEARIPNLTQHEYEVLDGLCMIHSELHLKRIGRAIASGGSSGGDAI